MNQGVTLVNDSDIVVKKEAAEKQLASEKKEFQQPVNDKAVTGTTYQPIIETPAPAQKVMRRFYLSANLKDHPNPQRYVKDIFDDIIAELKAGGGDEQGDLAAGAHGSPPMM